jgi:hypothetical protein
MNPSIKEGEHKANIKVLESPVSGYAPVQVDGSGRAASHADRGGRAAMMAGGIPPVAATGLAKGTAAWPILATPDGAAYRRCAFIPMILAHDPGPTDL